jgi:hypothetical protein
MLCLSGSYIGSGRSPLNMSAASRLGPVLLDCDTFTSCHTSPDLATCHESCLYEVVHFLFLIMLGALMSLIVVMLLIVQYVICSYVALSFCT